MKKLIKNIGLLAGIDRKKRLRKQGEEMKDFETLRNAWLVVDEDRIKDFGSCDDLQCNSSADVSQKTQKSMPDEAVFDEVFDAKGGALLPSFCDSHTHIVYAGSREMEFVDKIQGLSYAEIARRGGGILNSADLLHTMSEAELYEQAMRRVNEIMLKGTGCVEIKSGYGLSLEDELKMLRVIQRIKESSPLRVVSTFLGAHAVARGMKQSDYVDLIVREMIPEVGRQKLADFIDVFCDEGFFTVEETARMLEEGAKWGMQPKIHADELAASGGVEVGVSHQALSVDHLESMDEHCIEVLRGSRTMPTALPGTSFFLNMPLAPARKMIDAGLAVATASDYNPGSTPSGDMKFIVSLACIKLRLLPEEALNAATINTAYAMNLSSDYGSIAEGKKANFFITDPIPSIAFIPYAYTTPIVRTVFLNGERQQ